MRGARFEIQLARARFGIGSRRVCENSVLAVSKRRPRENAAASAFREKAHARRRDGARRHSPARVPRDFAAGAPAHNLRVLPPGPKRCAPSAASRPARPNPVLLLDAAKPRPPDLLPPELPVPPRRTRAMHRIASLGDMQESNKHERHVAHGAPQRSTMWDSDDEQHAALVDFGHVFEWALKHTVVAAVTFAWQSVAGLYHVMRSGDYDGLWEPTMQLYHGDPDF